MSSIDRYLATLAEMRTKARYDANIINLPPSYDPGRYAHARQRAQYDRRLFGSGASADPARYDQLHVLFGLVAGFYEVYGPLGTSPHSSIFAASTGMVVSARRWDYMLAKRYSGNDFQRELELTAEYADMRLVRKDDGYGWP